MKRLRIARDGYILVSIAFYIAGVLLFVLPELPSEIVCVIGGAVLVVYGIIKMVGYWSDDLYCLAFQYDLAHGLLLLIVGALLLVCNLRLESYLVPGLGVLILLDGLLTVQTAKDAKDFGLERWAWMLGLAVATCAFGALVIANPPQEGIDSRILAGCALIVVGAMKHFVVRQTVQVHRRKPSEQ